VELRLLKEQKTKQNKTKKNRTKSILTIVSQIPQARERTFYLAVCAVFLLLLLLLLQLRSTKAQHRKPNKHSLHMFWVAVTCRVPSRAFAKAGNYLTARQPLGCAAIIYNICLFNE
jgi:hypothetical protein